MKEKRKNAVQHSQIVKVNIIPSAALNGTYIEPCRKLVPLTKAVAELPGKSDNLGQRIGLVHRSRHGLTGASGMQVGGPALGLYRPWRRVLLFAPLCLFLYPTYSLAQDDVAEAARQAQARKATKQESAPHVYTDEDLKRNKILTPEDQARIEARKKQQKPGTEGQNAKNSPGQPSEQNESLGEVARRYRLEKAAREAAEAAKKNIAPFPYDVPTPALAAPKPDVAPMERNASTRPAIRQPELAPVAPLAAPTWGNTRKGHARISPFQPRPLVSAPTRRAAPRELPAAPPVEHAIASSAAPSTGMMHPGTAPVEAPRIEPVGTHSIQVQPGDSWWKLAERYLGKGARWRELRNLNPGVRAPAEKLSLGTVIVVPESPAMRASAPTGGHILVQKGDTLWTLARDHLGHGSSWMCLAQANPQISHYNRLPIGATLQLPGGDALVSCKASNSASSQAVQ